MPVNPYITLTNSTSTVTKYFRVVADGYDDGLPEKTVSMSKTVGGGIDVSQGAIYKSWSPTIKVRASEPETGYGTMGELETFFSYNNPNGSPSDKITMIDHHGNSYTVVILGDMRKATLSAVIEGNSAWFLVRLRLQQVP